MTGVTPLLQIEDLYLHYLGGPGRTVHGVDGISFTLWERGRALGVVGSPATAWFERASPTW